MSFIHLVFCFIFKLIKLFKVFEPIKLFDLTKISSARLSIIPDFKTMPGCDIKKSRSYCDGDSIFLCHCHCRHEWVQYPFMTAMVTDKMGIMESSDGVHIAVVTPTEKIEFLVLSVAFAAAM